jgi:hypothetical protein
MAGRKRVVRKRGSIGKKRKKNKKPQNPKTKKKKEASDTPPPLSLKKKSASLLGRHSSAPLSNGSRPPVDTIVFSGLSVLFFSLKKKRREKLSRLSSPPLQEQPYRPRKKKEKEQFVYQSK